MHVFIYIIYVYGFMNINICKSYLSYDTFITTFSIYRIHEIYQTNTLAYFFFSIPSYNIYTYIYIYIYHWWRRRSENREEIFNMLDRSVI